MFDRLRRHLSYANVMATAAVFLALGGVSYAAVVIPKNSVGNPQLKPTPSPLGRSKTGRCSPLISGAASSPGATGAPGTPGISNYRVVINDEIAAPAGTQTSNSADCPAGTMVISGGVAIVGGISTNVNVNSSFPIVTTTNGRPSSTTTAPTRRCSTSSRFARP